MRPTRDSSNAKAREGLLKHFAGRFLSAPTESGKISITFSRSWPMRGGQSIQTPRIRHEACVLRFQTGALRVLGCVYTCATSQIFPSSSRRMCAGQRPARFGSSRCIDYMHSRRLAAFFFPSFSISQQCSTNPTSVCHQRCVILRAATNKPAASPQLWLVRQAQVLAGKQQPT